MASKFYGLAIGATENPENVTVGSATAAATHVELRINTGVGLTRNDAYRLAKVIIDRVIDGNDANLPGV